MKIPGIINLQKFHNYNITDSISVHAQSEMKSQIRSIAYSLKVLYTDLNIPKLEISDSVMQSCGITHIGNTVEEGIRIIGNEHNHIISNPKPNEFRLSYLNKINGQVERIITVQDKSIYEQSKLTRGEDFEDSLSETLDFIEGKLFKFKQKVTPDMPKPFIPNQAESTKLEKINRVLRTPKTAAVLPTGVHLSPEEIQLAKNIAERFNAVKEAFKNFGNDVTRHNVKTYYKNYISSESSINTMTFKNIGINGENMSITLLKHKGEQYLMLRIPDSNNPPKGYIISKEGTVQKNMPYELVHTKFSRKRYDTIPDYYTKSELETSNLNKYLECAEKELKLFEEHTLNWQKKQADFIAEHTNNNIGSTSMYTPKINKIFNSIEKFKENLRKHFPYLSDSEDFRRANDINIEFSRRGIKFPKITPENYDLRITFPSVKGKRASQILVMDGDNIQQSFYILDEKLLKFEVKKLQDAFIHYDRKIYYHPQEYIDSCRLGEYIDLMLKTLNKANRITTSYSPEK